MSAVVSKGKGPTTNQSDLMLWVAGALVAVLGATWLILTKPWSAGVEPDAPPSAAADAPAEPDPAAAAVDQPSTDGAALQNPLRMAQLAFEAGMLIEPEDYSAWALYRQVLQLDPSSAAARDGLQRVADELVGRADVAIEQGRFSDAQRIVDRILTALPTHDGALNVKARLEGAGSLTAAVPARDLLPAPVLARPEIAARQPEMEPALVLEPAPRQPAEQRAEPRPAERPPAPAQPRPDPLAQALEQFEAALAANRLLTPADESAKHYAAELQRLGANDPRTAAARAKLTSVFLARATQALGSLDTTAANTWIDEAEALGSDPAGVEAARAAVVDRLVAMEAARPLPASELKVVEYVAPIYPERANARGLTGWVDIEFVVGTDGRTKDVTVVDASHATIFRREAQEAVEQWRFEPREFMGRKIEQRSFTRIRFVR